MARKEVVATVTGTVWKVEAAPGITLSAAEAILIVESMKMEISVVAPAAGTVAEVLVREGDTVDEGQVVAVMDC